MIDEHQFRSAKKAIPSGYYPLKWREPIRPTDLVWNWTKNEWLPANSPLWKFPTASIPRDSIICVIRKAESEIVTPTVRKYTIKREVVQGNLF